MKTNYRFSLTVLLLAFLLFPFKMFYLMYCFSGEYKIPQNRKRAEIVDSEGNLLATSMTTYSVYYIPYEVVDPYDEIANSISKILGVDFEKIYKRLLIKNKFVWVMRHITPKKANKISSLGYSGIYVTKDCIRFYPFGDLFLHILGKVNNENKGITGVEKYYDEYLKNDQNPALKLSLKSSIQHVLKEELIKGKKKYSANFVSGIIACAKTGKILAMFSKNDDSVCYNPHIFSSKNDLNTAIQSRYELGSIMKTFSSIMFLEHELVDLDTMIDIPAYYSIGSHQIKDYGMKHLDSIRMSFEDSFIYSSNIAFVSLADKLNLQDQISYYSKLGLFEAWNIDKLVVSKSLVPKNFRKCDVAVFSYGYGISLSIATYLRAFLRIVSRKNLSLHIEENFIPNEFEKEKIIKLEPKKKLFYLLNKSFSKYFSLFKVDGIKVGGKTGTAKKHDQSGYLSNNNLTSYVFVYPINKPKIVGIVLLDDPMANGNALYSSQSAMLVAFSIIKRLIKI